jgi:hypothetical protein
MNNPYINSLGNALNFKEFSELVYQIPEGYTHSIPDNPVLRQILVERIGVVWFLPELKHYEFYCDVYRVLHHGWLERKGKKRIEIFKNTRDWLENYKNRNWVPISIFKKPIITVSLFGSPGMGKSHFWDLVMPKCFKQVVKLNDGLLVTHLVLNCSAFSSLKALCLGFFAELDNVLIPFYESINMEYKNSYTVEFTKKVYTAEKMLPYMANVAAQHNLGVLVIDEVNHLTEGNRDPSDITKFFKNLTRAIGLPIIFSGTQNGIHKLSIDLQSTRRIVGFGMTEWKFYKSGSKEWKRFLTELWKFQITNERIEVTDEISEVFYELTGGVMDLSIKLFVKCQTQAIEHRRKVDVKFIRAKHAEFFRATTKVVSAINSKDPFLKNKYRDINEGFPELLEEIAKENDLTKISHKLLDLNLTKDQASMLIDLIKMQHPSISNGEAEAKVRTTAKEVKAKSKPKEKKGGKKAKVAQGLLPTISAKQEGSSIKEELENIGISGPLNKIL